MKYDPARHHRRSIRLKGYDYTQAGAYFVTICTQHRECLWGDVIGDEMQLNDAGQMVKTNWDQLPQRFPTVELDEYVVMPNHLHGILVIVERARAGTRPAPTQGNDVGATLVVAPNGAGTSPASTLGDIVGAFKSLTTDEYIVGVHQRGWPHFDKKVWQRNYYEHIIRNDRELNAIRRYIQDNPKQWALDRDNADNLRHLPFPTHVEEYLEDVQALFKDDCSPLRGL